MSDQYTMQDPTKQYPGPDDSFEQQQKGPGLQQEMGPKPDSGESTYRGSGRLKGRRAVVTGADSGNRRAAANAYARESAGLVLSRFPEEERDVLRSQGQQFAANLEAAGVPTTATHYEGVMHEFFGASVVLDKAEAAQQEAAAHFAAALDGPARGAGIG